MNEVFLLHHPRMVIFSILNNFEILPSNSFLSRLRFWLDANRMEGLLRGKNYRNRSSWGKDCMRLQRCCRCRIRRCRQHGRRGAVRSIVRICLIIVLQCCMSWMRGRHSKGISSQRWCSWRSTWISCSRIYTVSTSVTRSARIHGWGNWSLQTASDEQRSNCDYL